jgi:hypothetical protein
MYKKALTLLFVGSVVYADTHLDMNVTCRVGEKNIQKNVQVTMPNNEWTIVFEEEGVKMVVKAVPFETGVILNLQVDAKDENGEYQCLSQPDLLANWDREATMKLTKVENAEEQDVLEIAVTASAK